MANENCCRWGHLGVWERLLEAAQAGGVALGMAFLDGSNIRAHQKAAGAARNSATKAERDDREALGRSRGGFGTKACVVAEAGGGGGGLGPRARAGARVADRARPAGLSAGRARLGGRRPWPGLARLSPAHLGPRRTTRD